MNIQKLCNITFALGFRYYRTPLNKRTYLHVLNIFLFFVGYTIRWQTPIIG